MIIIFYSVLDWIFCEGKPMHNWLTTMSDDEGIGRETCNISIYGNQITPRSTEKP